MFKDYNVQTVKNYGGLISSTDTTPEGFVNVANSGAAITPVVDTWTTVPNDGLGSLTNMEYLPLGITSLFNLVTGEIDLTQLKLGDTVYIRHQFEIIPATNNQTIDFRLVVNPLSPLFTLDKFLGTFRKSTQVYNISVLEKIDLFNPLALGLIIPQILTSGVCTIRNLGFTLSVNK